MLRRGCVKWFLVVGAAFYMATSATCTKEEWRRVFDTSDKGAQPEPTSQPVPASLAAQGTIGQLVTIDGLRYTQVRGFGLVVDLVDTGGSDGPEIVKNYLIKEMRRHQDPSEPGPATKDVLESKDTAMVEVTGFIPAAAKKGERFDVIVRALGTQTKSLVGGRLVLCTLKLYAETPRGVIEGATLANASGPVFVSPLDLEGNLAKNVDLRAGLVMGGGLVKEDRRVRLVLNDPRYSVAQQIVARINGRYSTSDPIAVGQSPSVVDLRIPDKVKDRKRLFMERALFTTMISGESFLEQRSRDLAEVIARPEAEYESVGLAWEAIGQICLPTVRELYNHPTPEVSYYAGRTGMRLGDQRGMEVVARFAKEPGSTLRDQAIDELGMAEDMYAAGEHLRKLLDDPVMGVRIRAYKALRRRPHRAIQSRVLYQDNLILDVVESSGPFMIYVQRSMAPRIAIFGEQMACRPPAMFPGERKDGRRVQTQISAKEGDEKLTVIFTNKRTGRHSPPLTVSTNVAKLIEFMGGTPVRNAEGEVQALGSPYSEIVDILATFCDEKTKTIPAAFVAEDLTGREEYKEPEERERKESEY